MRIVITGLVPSKKNSKRIVSHRNRPMLISSSSYMFWRNDAIKQIQVARIKPVVGAISEITITLFPPNRIKGDLSNKAESVMDALVDAGIIEDDNWFVVPNLSLKFGGVDRLHPRVEVDII